MLKILMFLIVFSSGCERMAGVPSAVDRMLFSWQGGTVFASPDHISLKEIHLDNGTLIGRQIVVEGVVLEVGQHSTYLVMSDETARILVVLTGLHGPEPLFAEDQPKVLRVLGTVESGRRSLPYLRAHAIKGGSPEKL